MPDEFDKHATGISGPAKRGAAVTPNDSSDLAFVTRGFSVGAAGDVRMQTSDGSEVTAYFAAGVLHPVRVKRIYSTGTTATGIVAWD